MIAVPLELLPIIAVFKAIEQTKMPIARTTTPSLLDMMPPRK
jgi:hypothetical protein